MEAVPYHLGLGWWVGIGDVGKGDTPAAGGPSLGTQHISTAWPFPGSHGLFIVNDIPCSRVTHDAKGGRKFGHF